VPSREESSTTREQGSAAVGDASLAQVAGQFPDVAPPAIGGLFVLIVVYLIVVGPFDYFVLRRLRRLELTWITFPAYVALFTLLILFAGGAFIERAAYQREIVVVDRAAGAPQERRRALSAVLAPRNQRYSLRDVEPISSNYLASQFGSLDLGNAVLLRAPELSLQGWTISRGATALVTSDRGVPSAGALSWTVTEAGLDVRNDSGRTLEGAALFTREGVFDLGELPTGASVRRLPRRSPLNHYLSAKGAVIHSELNGDEASRSRDNGERIRTLREDSLDHQLRRTLLALTFQEGLRGTAGFARTLDARRWLNEGGSILVAWEKPSRAEVAFDPPPNRFTGLAMIRYFQGPSK
jgi:hypothetical protein